MKKATGEFKITGGREDTYADRNPGRLTRAGGSQDFSGDIVGAGRIEWLMCDRADRTAQLVTASPANKPGSLAKVARKLARAVVNVEAALPTGMSGDNVHVAFATDNPSNAKEALGEFLLTPAYSRLTTDPSRRRPRRPPRGGRSPGPRPGLPLRSIRPGPAPLRPSLRRAV